MIEKIAPPELSPWWGRAVAFTLILGFSILILIAVTTYRNAPPIPVSAVTSSGSVLFTQQDVALGQEVFLKYGLMDNGSVWGHGAYLGPDFTASYLHDMAVDLAGQVAVARFGRRYADLGGEDKAPVGGIVALRLKKNGYDPATGVLTLSVGNHGFFDRELLLIALTLWFWLLYRTVTPCFKDPSRRPLAIFLLVAAAAIPLFYTPALFFGSRTHFAIVDMWRFWIAHLWLEGFFELFVTVIVSIIFYQLALVSRITALRTIYLDAILYFAGGVIGTGHHLYFSGQTDLNMALAASISALEVVPLTLISLEAWPFIKMMRLEDEPVARHKWTFYFLMSVGFWNFLGAGVFGFLINLPIVSYFEIGTILTPNHAHTAMMGVFGMLSVGLMAFIVRETVTEEVWPKISPLFRCAFWGLNVGLAAMFVLSLFPAGFMQLMDVAQNGYWHARSIAYTGERLPRLFEWFRLPGDVVFIMFGAVPVVLAVFVAYVHLWTDRRATQAPQALSPTRTAHPWAIFRRSHVFLNCVFGPVHRQSHMVELSKLITRATAK